MQNRQIGRLTRRPEFLAAARGRKAGGKTVGLQGLRRRPTDSDDVRLGFTCSKKVGNAVARNRAKRRLRAAAARLAPELALPGCDYVLIGRPATVECAFDILLADMTRAFKDVAKKLEPAK